MVYRVRKWETDHKPPRTLVKRVPSHAEVTDDNHGNLAPPKYLPNESNTAWSVLCRIVEISLAADLSGSYTHTEHWGEFWNWLYHNSVDYTFILWKRRMQSLQDVLLWSKYDQVPVDKAMEVCSEFRNWGNCCTVGLLVCCCWAVHWVEQQLWPEVILTSEVLHPFGCYKGGLLFSWNLGNTTLSGFDLFWCLSKPKPLMCEFCQCVGR